MTQKAKYISVKIVAAALGDNVDDSACSSPKLRRVGIRRYLILLYGLLTHRRACRVDGVVRIVGSVNLHQCRTSALAADIQARRRRWSNRAAVVTSDG